MVNEEIDIGFSQQFKTKYGMVPFSQTYIYEADSQAGMYVKYVKGAKSLLALPTVIVDVHTDAATGQYDLMTEFTCKEEAGIQVATELRFSSRGKSIDDATFAEMQAKAIAMGIDESIVNNVLVVDQSGCRNNEESVFTQ